MDANSFVSMVRIIRVLNNVGHHNFAIPITYTQWVVDLLVKAENDYPNSYSIEWWVFITT